MELEQQEISILHSDSGPYGIAISHEGKVWFTQHKANKISCIDKKEKFKRIRFRHLMLGPCV